MKKQFLFLVLLGLLCSVGNVWGIDPVIWNLQKTYSSASESELASSGTNWKYSSNVYTYKKALSNAMLPAEDGTTPFTLTDNLKFTIAASKLQLGKGYLFFNDDSNGGSVTIPTTTNQYVNILVGVGTAGQSLTVSGGDISSFSIPFNTKAYSINIKATGTSMTISSAKKFYLYQLAVIDGGDVVAPVITSPEPGSYYKGFSISLSCETEDVTIKFKQESSAKGFADLTNYSSAFTLSSSGNRIVSTCATKEITQGTLYSDMIAYNFTRVDDIPTPVATPAAGTYNTTQNVELSAEGLLPNGVIRYTTDGNTPSKSSAEYTSPIEVSATTTIKAYVFDALRPTPELSYAVRHLGCIAGINITASHNPPEYNGYKVYWEDGAQITPPHDTGIMDEVKAITDYASCKTMEKSEAVEKGLYIEVGDKEVDTDYIEELKKNVLHPEAIRAEAKNLKIVYTPLHGTGLVPAKRVLKELGFENVLVVPEQEKPDGEFPTVSYPNPEADEAFTLGLKLAQETGADLVLATDPDADRLGVRVRDKDGVYHTLTGNMSGSLLADYEIGQRKALKGLPEDGLLIKTIVTTNLADAICKYYGVAEYECLTGFKWIGRQILKMENEGKGTYLFGFEESYGCLIGTHARDKDAIVAVMALCEAAAYYRTKNMTLWDAMLDLYERCGYYRDNVTAIGLKGISGLQKIQEIMTTLRQNTPAEIAGCKVLSVRDYETDKIRNLVTGEETGTGLPKSNVLYYELEGDAWLCVRPSGTEPKIKFYYGIVGTSLEDAQRKDDDFKVKIDAMVNEML